MEGFVNSFKPILERFKIEVIFLAAALLIAIASFFSLSK
jgi:hypothetical protein